MISTFSKLRSKGYRRLILLVAMMTLILSLFAGCKKEEIPEDTKDNTPPNLIQTETTAPEETESEETEPPAPSVSVDGDTATIAVGPVNIQSLAGPDGKVIGHLNAGDQVEILRQVDIDYIRWAMIRDPKGSYGWICMDNLDQAPGGEETPAIPEDPNEDYKPDHSNPPEETKPADNKPQNNNNTMSQKGVVTGSELNIRSKPSMDGERVGSLTAGTRVTILEKKDGWGRIKDGWISLKYVYLDGETGTNTAKGVVITDNLNVRGGPGTNYDRVTSYSAGKRVQILEQILVGDTKWGCTKDGWIAMKYVYVDGTTGENSGKGTVTGSELNIRTGPGTNFDSIGAYKNGDRVDILTQIKIGDMTWGCTSKGWIAMKYVDMDD